MVDIFLKGSEVEASFFHLLLDPLLLSGEEEDAEAEDDSRLISVLQWLFPLVGLSGGGGCCPPLVVGCGG